MADATIVGLTGKDFYQVKSLQQIACVNVIGAVCINHVQASDEEVYKILMQFNLPSSVNSLIRQLVMPICKSFKDWYSFQFLKANSPTCQMTTSRFVAKHGFHWMWCGVVDFDRMANVVVQEECFGIYERFLIACEYSLAADIYSLWDRLPADKRALYVGDNKLVKYWRAVLIGDVTTLVNSTRVRVDKLFRMNAALENGNLSSIRYFWKQMNDEEHSQRITEFARVAFIESRLSTGFFHPCIVPFFLLHSCYNNSQLTLYGSAFHSLLNWLSMWPWQDLFVPFIDGVFSSVDRDVPESTMQELLRFIQSSLLRLGPSYCRDPLLECIVKHVWQKLAKSHKDRFFILLMCRSNLEALFATESRLCLDAIFCEAESESLVDLAFSRECVSFVYKHMKQGNWKVVELIVKYMLQREHQELTLFQWEVARHTAEVLLDGSSEAQPTTSWPSTFMLPLEKLTKQHLRNGL